MYKMIPALVVLAAVIRIPSAAAEYPPDVLTTLTTEGSVTGLASNAQYIYYTDSYSTHLLSPALGELKSWVGLVCYTYGLAVDDRFVFVSDNAIGTPCSNDNIFKFTTDGTMVDSWCPANWTPGGAGITCSAGHLAVDADGNLFATSGSALRKYDPDGHLLAQWDGGSEVDPWDMEVGPDGNLYVVDLQHRRVLRFTPELTGYEVFIPHGDDDLSAANPQCVTFDRDGTFYLMDRTRGTIRKFDDKGRLVVEWPEWGLTGAATVDSQGYLYVAAGRRIIKFDNKPGSPPEESLPPHPAAIFLHVGQVTGQRLACDEMPRSPSQVVTQGSADPSGKSRFYVYLLGSPQTLDVQNAGITGMQMGIRFMGTSEDDPRIGVFGWTPCSVMNFPQDGWPASGTGNTITWTVNPSTCQQKEMVLAGFMYVSAYAPAIVSLTGFPTADPENPSHNRAKVTDCQGAEIVVDPSRLAWVSFGGAAVAGDDAGCNPLYGPCQQALVPVFPTTWGRLKTKYTPDHE